MKPNGLKNKTRENHKIDGLSPDANKLRGHSKIINVETLTKNIDLAGKQREPCRISIQIIGHIPNDPLGRLKFHSRPISFNNDGAEAVLAQAYLMDFSLKLPLKQSIQTLQGTKSNPRRTTLYYRCRWIRTGRISSFSDIDLLFLLPYKQTPVLSR